ncbi:MAG: DUF2384 domain-containing protein [Gammaproteobacteria bacterium]|nr:DUF2384 domain-containing protein [Gammaproteobacteria bacterium]
MSISPSAASDSPRLSPPYERRERSLQAAPPANKPTSSPPGGAAGLVSLNLHLTTKTGRFNPSLHTSEASRPRGVFDAFVNTCQRWRLGQEEQVVLLGRQPGDSLVYQLLAGRIRVLSIDAEDRAGYIVVISLALGALFDENIEAENDWLRQPRAGLEGKTPLEHMLEGSMVHLLDVVQLTRRERGL